MRLPLTSEVGGGVKIHTRFVTWKIFRRGLFLDLSAAPSASLEAFFAESGDVSY